MEHIPDDCFDVIIDKALFDTLLCHENNLHKVEDYLSEMYRVMKITGMMIIISHGLPMNRLDYFDPEKWVVDPISIRKYRRFIPCVDYFNFSQTTRPISIRSARIISRPLYVHMQEEN